MLVLETSNNYETSSKTEFSSALLQRAQVLILCDVVEGGLCAEAAESAGRI